MATDREIQDSERMVRMETEMKNVAKCLDENRQDHKLLFQKIDTFIDAADKRYVTKSVLTFALSGIIALLTLLSFIFMTRGK